MAQHSLLFDCSVFFARSAMVALCVLIGFRLFGKRQLGQMNIYDLAMIMAVANAVQNAMTAGRGELAIGLACVGSLLTVGRILTTVFLHYPKLESQLLGTPTLLIENGRVIRTNIRREGITEQQLLTALREHGLETPAQARLGILEVDGSLSVVPKDLDQKSRA